MPIEADYVASRFPNRFVIGYGMDYAERYRGVADIRIYARRPAGPLDQLHSSCAICSQPQHCIRMLRLVVRLALSV